MAQSKLVKALQEKGYVKAEAMWKLVDDPDEYINDLSEDVVKRIGSNSYLITKDMVLELAPEYARDKGISIEQVQEVIVENGFSDMLDFYGAYCNDVVVQTSFGESDVLAVGVE